MADQLSEVFDLIEVRAVVSGSSAAEGAWVSRGALHESLKLTAMVRAVEPG